MNQRIKAHSTRFGMGTVITHDIIGPNANKALKDVHLETRRLESLLSRFIASSDISLINRNAGMNRVKIHQETVEVLAIAKHVSWMAPQKFDVTIGPLVDLWRSAKKTSQRPPDSEISTTLTLIDSDDLILDSRKCTAKLSHISQSIDLGGIAKGYAADRICDKMRKRGITSAYTDFGGNIATIGGKPDGSPWRVGIQHPRRQNALIGVIEIKDQSVVTSGDYQQFFLGPDNKRYHHILDPRTGLPAESGLISVTIVSPSSVEADALSTAIFVAGKTEAARYLIEYPNAMAILIDNDLNITISNGLQHCFHLCEDHDIQSLVHQKGIVSNESEN